MIEDVVEFLIKENALQLGNSPWPSYTQDDDVYPVRWSSLFPSRRPLRDGSREWDLFGDDWAVEFDRDFLAEIEEALGKEPSLPTAEGIDSNVGGQWDVCAWYQPVHFFGYDWGIFIREDCLRRQAVRIANFVRPSGRLGYGGNTLARALIRAATYSFFLHEHFHHKVECLGFRFHVIERQSRYLPYQSKVYQPTMGTDDQLEEALANADMYHRLGDKPYKSWISKPVVDALRKYLRWSFPFNPPGYRVATKYLSKDAFECGENLLHGQVKEAALSPVQATSEWNIAPRLMQSFFSVTSDIWTVVPKGQRSMLPTGQPVRTCGTRQLISFLSALGYSHVGGAKHDKLERSGWPTIILPRNRDNLSPGVVRTTLQSLGSVVGRQYSVSELPRLLSGEITVGTALEKAV